MLEVRVSELFDLLATENGSLLPKKDRRLDSV
jgi:hypothetical protein